MSSTAWLHALLRHSQTRIVAAAASVTALVSTCSAVTPQTVWLEGGEDSGSSGSTTVSLGHRQRYASKQVAQLLSTANTGKVEGSPSSYPPGGCVCHQFRGRAVIIRPAEFAMKRRKLIAGGASKLQVIADFDRTMTSCFITGRCCTACSTHKSFGDHTHRSHIHQTLRGHGGGALVHMVCWSAALGSHRATMQQHGRCSTSTTRWRSRQT